MLALGAPTIAALNERWHRATPSEIIHEALGQFPDIAMTSGFNLNGVVLIDMAVKAGYRGKLIFIDTGYHFAETLELRAELEARYPELEFITLNAQQPDDRLFERDTDLCCHRRKVEPLREYLAELKPSALLSARNQAGATTRAGLEPLQTGERFKVNPLFNTSMAELEQYVNTHDLKLNPLYAQGFLSIGCAPCTRAVKPGEDVRAGRWAGQAKTECGLWWGKDAL